jgi:O6-methylguanine-DNA--protein-cysteine methyltransferase
LVHRADLPASYHGENHVLYNSASGGNTLERVYISKIKVFGDTWKITASDRGIVSVYPSDTDFIPFENAITEQAVKELKEYLVHIRTTFSVPLDLRGTPFQKQVWEDR